MNKIDLIYSRYGANPPPEMRAWAFDVSDEQQAVSAAKSSLRLFHGFADGYKINIRAGFNVDYSRAQLIKTRRKIRRYLAEARAAIAKRDQEWGTS